MRRSRSIFACVSGAGAGAGCRGRRGRGGGGGGEGKQRADRGRLQGQAEKSPWEGVGGKVGVCGCCREGAAG